MTVDEPSEFGLRVSPTTQSARMTEEVWLSSTTAGPLLEHVRRLRGPSPLVRARKCRLAAAEIARRYVAGLVREWEAVEVADRTASFDATLAAMREHEREVAGVAELVERLCDGQCSLREMRAGWAGWGRLACMLGSHDALDSLRGVVEDMREWHSQPTFGAVQCSVIRDIFGNPFRPVAFEPAWRTTTAVELARQMYESRDFSLMPILADALQDAGCENAEVLGHCRGPGPHARGCWVVDLVLGKA